MAEALTTRPERKTRRAVDDVFNGRVDDLDHAVVLAVRVMADDIDEGFTDVSLSTASLKKDLQDGQAELHAEVKALRTLIMTVGGSVCATVVSVGLLVFFS